MECELDLDFIYLTFLSLIIKKKFSVIFNIRL